MDKVNSLVLDEETIVLRDFVTSFNYMLSAILDKKNNFSYVLKVIVK